jgi:hypothetical protein
VSKALLHLTDRERTSIQFADWLKQYHSGKDNAVLARNMKHWGTRRAIRLYVHELRRRGYPICSGGSGYYYAGDTVELDATLSFLDSMAHDLQKVISGLRETRKSWGE